MNQRRHDSPGGFRPAPYEVILEFARATDASDPFAFQFREQPYLLRESGGAVESASFPWSQALLADLQNLQRPQPSPEVAQRLGEVLRRFLHGLGWEAHEERIEQALRHKQRVNISIRSSAAELYALPWELCSSKATGEHLGARPDVLLRYEWPQTQSASPDPDPPTVDGRILVAWSAAGGAVPAAEHVTAVREAVVAGQRPAELLLELPHVSLRRLGQELAKLGPPVAVLHILCHGGAPENGDHGYGLVWDGNEPNQTRVVVDADALRRLLAPYVGTLRMVVLAACSSGDGADLGAHLGSVAQALHRVGIPVVVASRYPLSVAASIAATQVLYHELLVELQSLEGAFLRARAALVSEGGFAWGTLQLYVRASDNAEHRPVVIRPYRGLAAFLPQDQRFYCGREQDVARIVERLVSGERLVTVVGASGSGKSSLVLAGVVPAVRDGALGESLTSVCIVRPGKRPCAALVDALTETLAAGTSAAAAAPALSTLRSDLLRRPDALAEAISGAPGVRLLVIVDQFEELFLLSDRTEAEAFLDNLLHAVSLVDGRMMAVLTLRADMLGLCLARPVLAEKVRATLDLILPMNREDLRAAILRPAALAGLRFEEGLADALLAALADSDTAPRPAQSEESTRNQNLAAVAWAAGNLPVLQFTMEQLWDRRQKETITWESWRSIGGVRGAIARRADEVLAISRKAGEEDLVRQLFGRLVQLGEGTVDTRRPASREEIEAIAPGRMKPVLDRWIDARMLTADATEVAFIHESLLHEWETLRRFIDESRESLRVLQVLSRDVRHYVASGKNNEDLWHGTPLRRALELRGAGRLNLSAAESAFLDESVAAVERQRSLVEEQRRHDYDRDVRVGEIPRAIAVMTVTVAALVSGCLLLLYFSKYTHRLIMLQLLLTAGAGAGAVILLRKTLLAGEFNRKAALLVFSSYVPMLVVHWVAMRLGLSMSAALVMDLNVILTVGLAATFTLDRSGGLPVLLGFVAIPIGTIFPRFLPFLFTTIPFLSLGVYLYILRRRARSENKPTIPELATAVTIPEARRRGGDT